MKKMKKNETILINKSSQAKMKMSSNASTIPFTKIEKYVRYDRLAIDKLLEDHQIQGGA